MQINLPRAFTAIQQWVTRPSAKPSEQPAVQLYAGPQADTFVRQGKPVSPAQPIADSAVAPPRPRVILFSSSHLLDGVKVGTATIQKRRNGKSVDSTVTLE